MANPVGVYYLNQSTDTEPDHFIELKEARQLKKQNRAFFINHGKAIRLLETAFCPPVPEERQKSKWTVRPSGLQAIGFVDVLQLV